MTDDGTKLAVEEIGSPDAPLTVLFVHGFCLNASAWAPQRRHLATAFGDDVRLVFYDHRGHGNSTEASPRTYTIDQLGDDLDTILDATTPTGQVILAGHSMGGMTVLSFAARHPDKLERITAVALLSTAANQLTSCGIGKLLRTPMIPLLQLAAQRAPRITRSAWEIIRSGIAPALGIPVAKCPTLRANQKCGRMICTTPIATIAALLAAFRDYDQTHAVAALTHLPALIACGTADPITPVEHSIALAEALPNAELIQAPGAGHMLGLERPGQVNSALIALIERVQEANRLGPAEVRNRPRRLASVG